MSSWVIPTSYSSSIGTVPVGNGGTGTTTSTGTGSVVLSNTPTITTPTISLINSLSSNFTISSNAGSSYTVIASTGQIGLNSRGQVLSIINNSNTPAVFGSTSINLYSGALTLSSAGTIGGTAVVPVANGGTGSTTATGTGSVVLSNSPTLVTPALGTPSSVDLTNAINLPLTGTTGTLAVSRGGTAVTSVTTAPTATAWAGWDSHACLNAQAFIGYQSGYLASGTTFTEATLPTNGIIGIGAGATFTFPTMTSTLNGRTSRMENFSGSIATITDGSTFTLKLYPGAYIDITGNNGSWSLMCGGAIGQGTLPANTTMNVLKTGFQYVVAPTSATSYNMDNTWPSDIVLNCASAGIVAYLPDPTSMPPRFNWTFSCVSGGGAHSSAINTFTAHTTIVTMDGSGVGTPAKVFYLDLVTSGSTQVWFGRWIGYNGASGGTANAD